MHGHTNKSSATLATLAFGALVLGGCQGAMVGNLLALGVTMGLFFGTLSLGRRSVPGASAPTNATRSVH